MKKYLVLEGFITSPLDNQRHFISCDQLVKLYKVDPKECVFGKADQYDPHDRRYEGKSIDGLCCLFPDSQGRYNIPQKFIPRAKNFEKEYSDDHKAYYVTNDEVYTLLKERPNFKFPSIYHAAHRMVNEIDGDYSQTVDLVYALLLKLSESPEVSSFAWAVAKAISGAEVELDSDPVVQMQYKNDKLSIYQAVKSDLTEFSAFVDFGRSFGREPCDVIETRISTKGLWHTYNHPSEDLLKLTEFERLSLIQKE